MFFQSPSCDIMDTLGLLGRGTSGAGFAVYSAIIEPELGLQLKSFR